MIEKVRFPAYLPYYSQIASLDLAEAVFSERLDALVDPRWHLLGADTPQEYAHWVMRACGIVCVKMCAEGFGCPRRAVQDWVRRGIEHQAYLILEENGAVEERGWIHGKMADLLAQEGLASRAVQADLPQMVEFLREGNLMIASVCYQLGTLSPVTFKGGHLVVVHGADLYDGRVRRVYIHNPSGRYPHLQAHAAIAAERFLQAYTGRGVLVGKA